MSDWEKLRETYEVTDEGIMFVQSCGNNYASYSMVIPKRTFIEAYNKYIKETNHVDKNTEQTEDNQL